MSAERAAPSRRTEDATRRPRAPGVGALVWRAALAVLVVVLAGAVDPSAGASSSRAGASAAPPPALTISPPSGRYAWPQAFDLVLILDGTGRSVTGGRAVLDSADVSGALTACVVSGTVLAGGSTFRCPGIAAGTTLGPGRHTISVALDLDDGNRAEASATWTVTAGGAGLTLEPVATGLTQLTAIVHAPDASGRLFVVLQTGQIRIVDASGVRSTPFLDLGGLVICCGERGLLGLAFHPAHAANGRLFVYHTAPGGDVVIAEYRISADPDRVDPGSRHVLLTIPHPTFETHNGGPLLFGPDGFLYAAVGDGGAPSDPTGNAQSRQSLLGKLLRLDVDRADPARGRPYAIPPDNPYAGGGGQPEIWALGLRNPWGVSFDRATGDLFVVDVGQALHEEVNFQPAGEAGGANYGWNRMEGFACYPPGTTGCQDGTLTLPVVDYPHANGDCAIIGGYAYRGTRIPELAGTYLFADYCSGRIRGTMPSVQRPWPVTELLATPQRLTALGEGADGEVYVGAETGGIFRLAGAAEPPRLTVSPPAGRYVTTQRVDVTLVLEGAGSGVLDGSATLDGDDVTPALIGCLVAEPLPAGGQVLRCRDQRLPPGTHTLAVAIRLAAGVVVSDTVTWEVLPATEP